MILRASSTVSTGSVVPGTIGTPASFMISRARVFEPMASIASAGGPMNLMPASSPARAKAALLARGCECGVLGEEAVAGVDRLRAGLLGGLDQLLDYEVALVRRPGADQV